MGCQERDMSMTATSLPATGPPGEDSGELVSSTVGEEAGELARHSSSQPRLASSVPELEARRLRGPGHVKSAKSASNVRVCL